MATPERLAPSRPLQSTATADRYRLGRELGRLDAKAHEWRADLDQIEATRPEKGIDSPFAAISIAVLQVVISPA
jgi:hypothetical protein